MDLAFHYLALNAQRQDAAAATRVNEYRRVAAERRALDETPAATEIAETKQSWWSRVREARILRRSQAYGNRTALSGRP
ncbi:MAG TPA: hypothetical protein VFE99_09690 [Agromyces sp.]|nr:hypothetical protein [Agromyces sp.]